LLTVLLATLAARENGNPYEGQGITVTKPAHDWILSRWNLGGGNGSGHRKGGLALLLTLWLIIYLMLALLYSAGYLRLKRWDDDRALRAAENIEEHESTLTKWCRSMTGWPRSRSQDATDGIELHAVPALSRQATRRSAIDEEAAH